MNQRLLRKLSDAFYIIFLMQIGTIVKHTYLRSVATKLVREVGSLVSQARLDQTVNETKTLAVAIGYTIRYYVPNFYQDGHYSLSPWILARLSAQRKILK
jgi:hypothetical protein